MIKVQVLFIGKSREPWLKEALRFYEERLKSTIQFSWQEVKDNERLLARVEGSALLLDPNGRQLDSEGFGKLFFDEVERGGSRLTFVIGGADGLPAELKQKGYPLVSFSKMVFTHQMIRLLLVEQVYRAEQIRSGRPYHRG